MSQKAVMIRVNGNLHEEVFTNVPDYDEAIQICKDFGYDESDGNFAGDCILVEYEWIEIGDGESGTDTFFDDETLRSLYESNKFEDNGYFVDTIETGSYEVYFDELEDD